MYITKKFFFFKRLKNIKNIYKKYLVEYSDFSNERRIYSCDAY